ncbi:hypothetical protein IDM40_18670 [Nocardiopsis sp. HNM0947]|uniref:ABC-2 type transport system permease protein n=1 Tax=Nocardiopsis coralli TaxID=2772213 RepID=A0ABR9PA36_9ACTN|nr:hypothetical protein [Nocardiopsis coralli]MBE3000704.1 hypothetical protein [Nocardiopsis coralli]
MVGELIRLKLTLQRHARSGTSAVAMALIVGGTLLTWYFMIAAPDPAVRAQLWSLATAVWAAGWIMGPTLANGVGALRPQYFALMPLERRRVGAGLLVTAFVGVGPVLTLVAVASLGLHAWRTDPATLPVALAGAAVLWVLLLSLSRLVFRALGAAMRTRFGMELASVQWGLFMAVLFFGWMAVQPAISAMASLPRTGLGAGPVPDVLAALPTGWPARAVGAAAAGAWGPALAWLTALVAVTAAVALAAAVLSAPSTAPRNMRRRARPAGSRVLDPGRRSLLPDTPLGAVVGKELRQWWRDPWRGLEVRAAMWAALFMGLLAWSVEPYAFLAPFTGLMMAMVMTLATANLYAMDGTALWMAVVGQEPGTARADVRGRQVAVLALMVPVASVLSALFVVGTGEHWAWPAVITGMVTLFGVGSGLSILLSVVMLTPGVDPHLRVDANDSGDNQLQVWTALLGTPLLSAPAIGATVWLYLAGAPWWSVPVGLVNGLVVAWGLGRLAHRRLDSRWAETFTHMRHGREAALQALPERGSWLDSLQRGALNTNEETRPKGT